ncbi:MAG: T9SS type A sorting domain-containing protein [Candidatus Azobacteroides sp.]|nr:T9SS type A sorting domain-containing protein [Candidatus Azobacteroides sp.]
MKRISILFWATLFGLSVHAQIELIGEISEKYCSRFYFDEIEGEEVALYVESNFDNSLVDVYDDSFNLKKNILLSKNWGKLSFVRYVDQSLNDGGTHCKIATADFFNDDDFFEFFLYKGSDGMGSGVLSIVNENNEVLWSKEYEKGISTYGAAMYDYILQVLLKKDKKGNKFMLISSGDLTEVYSVVGNSSSLNVNKLQEISTPYPNPASSSITLPYDLNGQSQGTIKIYTAEGKEVQAIPVAGFLDSFQLDTTSMASGHYFYVVETAGSVVEKNRFLVK